ncbi:hypothetical protein ACKUB1_17175 [Methanospirillum stamsii]|uniref:Uncharacterized protein n=1 Tax=Methanospirillum stamsii TaxID=1277351 RepID=A0A2V2NEP5_9EURY|nr:hypothetical protein [Methanospirillum stamsii]PWR74888.1 hypothetical protein DLD82_06575 [Methanospirillum stamsii]
MKLKILCLAICILLVVPIQAEKPSGNISGSDPLLPPNIATLYLDPDSYLGQTIIMKGIVATSYPKEHRFILSDSMGCASCQAARKNSETLNVIFSGEIPDKREIVLVSGKLTRGEDDTFSINATSVKK